MCVETRRVSSFDIKEMYVKTGAGGDGRWEIGYAGQNLERNGKNR